MFSHVMLGANDIQQSKKFYDATLSTLGYKEGVFDPAGRVFYYTETGIFCLSVPIDGKPACHANGSTIGFSVKTPEMADAWHQAGLKNGGTACEDAPGIREAAGKQLYLAYLRDPSGNKICALKSIK